ncbi:PTS mannitol transporter subunit IICB [Sporomusa sp.]|jgi:PTS system mannitol-specific IIC component|uniref:PTS mannitol transporter subunit IICB n=1 Tax=Sporomusa sp. TaxID=2078658 RepID=UPI002CAD5E4A|nr:PTS mannitol transporter subunit IICB [Sporomusa sp.]HWR09094.1 PTS mannitol transporter subunit IICB [Sporomusa sp.]
MRESLQKFGGFLAGMVIPNISAIICWGLITAFFIPTGWVPDEYFAKLVGPMIQYLLPMLIGFTGGRLVYGIRGGVIGATATMGVIVGSNIPMFMGAMVMGPFGGWVIKKFDEMIENKIPTGFEMLVNNFSAGILGMILVLLAYNIIGPVVGGIASFLGNAAKAIAEAKLLPLLALLVEPGKVLFLNNAINHGVFSPIGIAEVKEFGKSIFFLLEANPGPGLGLLLAYWVFGKGMGKQSAPGAIIIHFLGGIHEIYFPYILMNPLCILGVIAGGMAADLTFLLFNAGLVATPSPGSIFALLAMTPKGGLFGVLAGVTVGTVVSFLVSSPFVRAYSGNVDEQSGGDFASAQQMVKTLKPAKVEEQAANSQTLATKEAGLVKKIVFACEAGMGSSVMAVAVLKKKLIQAGKKDIEVVHSPVNQIPQDADIVLTAMGLIESAKKAAAPGTRVYGVQDFINTPVYDEVIKQC